MSIQVPPLPGCYALNLLVRDPVTIHVGRLGEIAFPAGNYIYVGSARGPGGLRARIARHLRLEKKIHWHIDRLTSRFPVNTVRYSAAAEIGECEIATGIASLDGFQSGISGFGASDCRCASHLFHFTRQPSLSGAGYRAAYFKKLMVTRQD